MDMDTMMGEAIHLRDGRVQRCSVEAFREDLIRFGSRSDPAAWYCTEAARVIGALQQEVRALRHARDRASAPRVQHCAYVEGHSGPHWWVDHLPRAALRCSAVAPDAVTASGEDVHAEQGG